MSPDYSDIDDILNDKYNGLLAKYEINPVLKAYDKMFHDLFNKIKELKTRINFLTQPNIRQINPNYHEEIFTKYEKLVIEHNELGVQYKILNSEFNQAKSQHEVFVDSTLSEIEELKTTDFYHAYMGLRMSDQAMYNETNKRDLEVIRELQEEIKQLKKLEK